MSIVMVLVVIALVAIGSNSEDSTSGHASSASTQATAATAPQNASKSSASDIPLIGEKGVITGTAMGCPEKRTVQKFYDQYGSAEAANDTVGEGNAIDRAIFSGCTPLTKGETGLVLDETGFLEPLVRIRLDKNEVAYWTNTEVVAPIDSASPN